MDNTVEKKYYWPGDTREKEAEFCVFLVTELTKAKQTKHNTKNRGERVWGRGWCTLVTVTKLTKHGL